MTTFIAIIVLVALAAVLVRYARHDHFAGPVNVNPGHDELGSLADRGRLVPRF